MYIMTHFMKNVLTFLFQYDIYISAFAQATVLGQKLPFSLSEPSLMKGENRVLCGIPPPRHF